MQVDRDHNEVMSDEEATPLHWFLLEVFTRQIINDRHEIKGTNEAPNMKKATVGTVANN